MKVTFSRIGKIGHLNLLLLEVHNKTLPFQKYSTSSTKWTLHLRNNKYELLEKNSLGCSIMFLQSILAPLIFARMID